MHRIGGKTKDMITPGLVARVTSKYLTEHSRRRAVRRVRAHYDDFVVRLWRDLVSGRFLPGRYHWKKIGGNGVKERTILVPTVRDAIAASVLVETFCDFADKRLYPHTFCNRRGLGSKALAVRMHAHIMRDKPKYYVKFDIRKCFDSVLHTDAVDYIRRVVKNRTVSETIIRLAIPAEITGDRGIPIGNGLSHHIANGVLSPIWFAGRRMQGVTGLWAYMDDVIITGNNKRKLMRAVAGIGALLAEHGFSYKYPPHVAQCTEGIDMVGFRFWPDGRRRLRRRNFRHARRAVHGKNPRRCAAYLGMAILAHDKPLVEALHRRIREGKRNGAFENRKH